MKRVAVLGYCCSGKTTFIGKLRQRCAPSVIDVVEVPSTALSSFDIRVYIDADADTRLVRWLRLHKDIDLEIAIKQFYDRASDDTWLHADIIVPSDRMDAAIELLADYLTTPPSA